MKLLVTGAAGFIGYHVCRALLERGEQVVGIDNLNDYYDVNLKQGRLNQLQVWSDSGLFQFERLDIADGQAIDALYRQHNFDQVVNLAAQAGVRYSLENPGAYIDSNITGFFNIIENCRQHDVSKLVYASSSSVYGANRSLPFSEHQNVDHPLSLYAATKKSNELTAHSYSSLYGIAATGLRFFTVYGPWGRPDMALFRFTRHILAGEPIELYNQGHHCRDFSYIDDVVDGVLRVIDTPATADQEWRGEQPDPASSMAPHRVYNIGRGQPVGLLEFVATLERCLGIEAKRKLLPMQAGDVAETHADVSALAAATGYQPQVSVAEGVPRFVEWYRSWYKV
jgi:UDP-glucuronate 4-epimerase